MRSKLVVQILISLLLSLSFGHETHGAEPYVSHPKFFTSYPEQIQGERAPEGAIRYQIIHRSQKIHWLTRGAWSLPFFWFGETPSPNDFSIRVTRIPKNAVGYAVHFARPLPLDAHYFDVKRQTPEGGFERGYPLKSHTSLLGNRAYVVEGNAIHQGVKHAGRFLKFLEPIIYCVFHKRWSNSR